MAIIRFRFVLTSIDLLLLLLLLTNVIVNGVLLPPKVFDVENYGAVADGRTDNAQAFLKTWDEACAYGGKSRFLVPRRTYLLGPVSFVGPCKGPISVIIKGRVKAPTDPSHFFTNTWIGFRYINDLTVKGGGHLDGQGSAAWKYNDCRDNQQCKPLPATLRLDFVTNSSIHHLRSINSKNTHFNLFACNNVNISFIRITAPADSPNTDGIRIGTSTNIKISRLVIGTGDDCISMVSGSQNIDIEDVVCGPGHGISIGSLGRSHHREYVTGIKVRNCTFIGADNGVRIKTWAPSLYSEASNISFENIKMVNTSNPIFIDQRYCPFPNCNMKASSTVQIKDVTFDNIRGISKTQVAVSLQCSGSLPCKNVKLIDIDLSYNRPGGKATSMCSNVIGSSYGKQIPGGCL